MQWGNCSICDMDQRKNETDALLTAVEALLHQIDIVRLNRQLGVTFERIAT